MKIEKMLGNGRSVVECTNQNGAEALWVGATSELVSSICILPERLP